VYISGYEAFSSFILVALAAFRTHPAASAYFYADEIYDGTLPSFATFSALFFSSTFNSHIISKVFVKAKAALT